MPQRSFMSYFRGSFIFAVIAIIAGGVYGYYTGGSVAAALTMAWVVAVLAVLETSLSFDNAVVNATILENWDDKWRRIFLTWGIWIAVFGMRIVFPIAVVAIAANMNPMDVINIALFDPATYEARMHEVHHEVAFFGGAFLAMVGLAFFFEERQVYWWEALESKLSKAGEIESLSAILVILVAVFASAGLGAERMSALLAAIFGVGTFIAAHAMGTLLGGGEDDGTGKKVIRAGVGGFLYIELLDASFSFDGVIGAFALTNLLVIIAFGLGVGAFFVRSMTIYLVDKGTLAEFRYLEHGAFYAIIALAAIMFLSGVGIELPEWITGLIGAAVIGAALGHSILANRKDKKLEQAHVINQPGT